MDEIDGKMDEIDATCRNEICGKGKSYST